MSGEGDIKNQYRFSDEQTLEVVQRNGLWGTRTLSICTNFQRIGSQLYCWKGNVGQNISYGWYEMDHHGP
jgi:hypothetical protein